MTKKYELLFLLVHLTFLILVTFSIANFVDFDFH